MGSALPLCNGFQVVCVTVSHDEDAAQLDDARRFRECGRHVLAEVTSRGRRACALDVGGVGPDRRRE